MLENMIKDILSHKTEIDEKKIALAKHGLDILISDGRNLLSVFLLSLVLKNTTQALLYLLVLSTLRVHTGGWHASSEVKCFLTYQGMFILFSFLNSFMMPDFINTVLMIASILYIVCCAPIEHKYNPLSHDEIIKNRYCCFVYCFLYLVAFILMRSFLSSHYSQAISIAFVYNVILMELLKRSKNYRYYDN